MAAIPFDRGMVYHVVERLLRDMDLPNTEGLEDWQELILEKGNRH